MGAWVSLCRGMGIPHATRLSDGCVGYVSRGVFAVGGCGIVYVALMLGDSSGLSSPVE